MQFAKYCTNALFYPGSSDDIIITTKIASSEKYINQGFTEKIGVHFRHSNMDGRITVTCFLRISEEKKILNLLNKTFALQKD